MILSPVLHRIYSTVPPFYIFLNAFALLTWMKIGIRLPNILNFF